MEAAPVPTHKRCRTALALAHDPLHCQRLTVGCPVIDKCLGGGFRSTGVTEVGAEQPLLLNCHDFPGFAPLCLKDCRGGPGWPWLVPFQIAGESGAGKTQLCLQLLLRVRSSGTRGEGGLEVVVVP